MARKRNVEIKDLMRLRFISDPQISPDGSRIAFVHTTIDYEGNQYVSDIWIVDVESGQVSPFTAGRGKDKYPRWSPDSSMLLFTSTPSQGDDEEKPQLYVIHAGGGEACKLTDLKNGVESPKWSPDGRQILFISPFQMEEQEDDIKVVRRIQYKYNARGLFTGIRKHLFTVRTRGGKPRQVTRGEFDIESAEWLHNGRDTAFISNLEEDADLTRAKHIYRVDIKGGEPAKLTEGKRTITALRLSPKEDIIAYTGHDFNKGLATNQDIWLLPVEGGESRNLTSDFDQDIGTKLSCDIRVSSPNPNPEWSADGEGIYFTSTYEGVARLYRVSRFGGYIETVLGDVDHSVEAWSMASNGFISYTKLGTTSPIELWLKKGEEIRQLTKINRRWENSLNICGNERFEFKSSMGHMVEGWLIRPPGFTEGRKYPMVIEIHGGPRGAYGYSFMHEFQVLASQGWVVMYVNPLGSGGYNEDYQAMLPGHYGEQDYTDIMEAVEHILKSYDFVDPFRLGVTGGSYGGYMTNWIVTHTDRFRAAVTQRSISNWVSMFGCSDIGWTFTPWEMDGLPWVDEEKYMAKSPIRYVANVKTPTLIIHSEEDHRCPMDQAEQFFTALKYLGVPTEFIRFHGENHDLSRSGKPKHREQRLNHIIRWFKLYLA